MRKLETLLNDFEFDTLPPTWTTVDLARFSRGKQLWNYQQTALQNAIKALWKYYENLNDYAPNETADADAERKRALMNWYLANDVLLESEIAIGKKRDNVRLLSKYYSVADDTLPYRELVNRMGFWMATGSGKTLVIVKLIEVLQTLMQNGEIPQRDILMLTHREDLLKQFANHIQEYNAAGGNLFIRLRELKEYAEVKRGFPSLLGHQEITVFYYRSDNLSDEQKERIIDFQNYANDGKWYVLLDEAHKGDKEDSKRQHIYSILSRNGFLFNFSATFTDARDILTTAHEFNLASFIEAGYGKHIALLKQENSAFKKDSGDFTDDEKQKIVLQSLLMLAYVDKARQQLLQATDTILYHRPLLLALVNSVNTDDADLKLFFAQLERLAQNRLSRESFQRAKNALAQELQEGAQWMYEDAAFPFDAALFNSLTMQDIWKSVFNADAPGAIEVLTRPSNDKELAFRLKSASIGAPFALIRIGNAKKWERDVLAGYEFVEGFEDESFFERLNQPDSEINLLLGSRSFYEGWDSNRPNVITFVNIGTGADAKKFILQSVGRGVRIEPLPGKRKRLASLENAHQVDARLFEQARPFLPAVETLFLFGTNRAALETVFKELDQEKEKEEGVELALERNSAAIVGNALLVPTYKFSLRPLLEQRGLKKFELPQAELDELIKYLDYLGDERLLLAHHALSPKQIGYVQTSIAEADTYFNTSSGRRFGNVNILLPRLVRYLDILPREVEGFKTLDDEINHYQHIRVLLKDIEALRKKIQAVQEYQDPTAQKAALKERVMQGELDLDAYTIAIEHLAQTASEELFTPPQGPALKIKHLARHYYLPLLLSEVETIKYINHIIHTESEIKFLAKLEQYLKQPENHFNSFDWWLFSRTDETLDKVVIPYYDASMNRMREFHPDFVFWLKRWNDYFILFVDPKGMRDTGYQYKVEGYKELFTENDGKQLRVFKHDGMNVRVSLALFTDDRNQIVEPYQEFWYDQPKDMLKALMS